MKQVYSIRLDKSEVELIKSIALEGNVSQWIRLLIKKELDGMRKEYKLVSGNWEMQAKTHSLETAMLLAEAKIGYNQHDMKIIENDKQIAVRRWYGCLNGIEDCENPIQFGNYGFYGDWEVE